MKEVTQNQWKVTPGVLAEREALYLTGFAAGKSTKQIAKDFGVSPNTVKKASTRILTKLNAWRMTEAIANACHEGILKHISIAFLVGMCLGAVNFDETPYRPPQGRTGSSMARVRQTRREGYAA
ncbi:MAG: LuxR family transcriptional regulator [Saccharospirillum sp.]|nr:LuxR family transcriptional regulator [Saccharospirillum sp.]